MGKNQKGGGKQDVEIPFSLTLSLSPDFGGEGGVRGLSPAVIKVPLANERVNLPIYPLPAGLPNPPW